MADPYKQGEAEKLAEFLKDNPDAKISEPILWKGRLDRIIDVVRNLQHKCGFPEQSYQVKFNADLNVLRLSDYTTRHACEPGEFFWMIGTIICGGNEADYEGTKQVLAFVQGGPEPDEKEIPNHLYAVVTMLKRLRKAPA